MSPEQITNSPKKRPNLNKRIIIIAVGVAIVGLSAVSLYQFFEIKNLRNPEYAAEEAKTNAAKLKEKVGALINLPDEEATVATITDAEKLKGQEFFKEAANSDKVLIFTAAKKAVIYRESANKIINSGPIVLSSTTLSEQ
jgi:hypothetical protein